MAGVFLPFLWDNLRPDARPPRLPVLIMKFHDDENDGIPVGVVCSDLSYLDMVAAGRQAHARSLDERRCLDFFLFA